MREQYAGAVKIRRQDVALLVGLRLLDISLSQDFLSRYPPESGLVMLTVSFIGPDPTETSNPIAPGSAINLKTAKAARDAARAPPPIL